jgi:hypothetical protein
MYEFFIRPFRSMERRMMPILSFIYFLLLIMPYPNGEKIL